MCGDGSHGLYPPYVWSRQLSDGSPSARGGGRFRVPAFSPHTPRDKLPHELHHAGLELSVVEDVYKGVHSAVHEDAGDSEVVVDAAEVGREAEIHEQIVELVLGPTQNECRRNEREGFDRVAPCTSPPLVTPNLKRECQCQCLNVITKGILAGTDLGIL